MPKTNQDRLTSLRPRLPRNSASIITPTRRPYQGGIIYPIQKRFYQPIQHQRGPGSNLTPPPTSPTGPTEKTSSQSLESGETINSKSDSTAPTDHRTEVPSSRGTNSPGNTEGHLPYLDRPVAPAPQPLSPKSQQPSPLPSTSTHSSLKIQTSSLETTQYKHTPKHRTHPPPFPILKKYRANPYPLPTPLYSSTKPLGN